MVKKMVILQVLPALEMGGVERGTVEVATALQKRHIKNYVVSSGGPMVKQLDEIGVEHITLPVQSKNPFVILMNAKRLAKVIRDKKITLIHVRSRAPAWSVKLASRQTGVPFIATYHGVYGMKPALFKKAYNRVMTAGKKVIAVSNFVKKHIVDNYQIPGDKIRVIHRGADTQKFDPKKVTKQQIAALKKGYQTEGKKPIITLVGRLTTWKGQTVLLDALKLMKQKDVYCLLVGSDQGRTQYTEKLKEQIKELPRKTEVKLISSCANMPALYSLSTVVVCPSLEPEAFGRVVTEAQAMGKIVVASGHGGAAETIQDGKTGFLFPSGDAVALARKLDQVLAMSTQKRKLIEQAGIQSVRRNFSIQKMCQKTIQTYQEISK